MNPGDLVVYRNTPRIPAPLTGIILEEVHGISLDQRFFKVLLPDGRVALISDHYLSPA